MYQLIFYVPSTHSETVKEALFTAGAGRIGNYECCAWETEGVGQYRPLPGSKPYIGEESLIEKVREMKVEMVCSPENLASAIHALKLSHPYETPAFFVSGPSQA